MNRFNECGIGIDVSTPKTWALDVDDELPNHIEFPLFVRTVKSSWKRGGMQGRVRNVRELKDEIEMLRRVFGWDARILVRQWIDVAIAGKWMFRNAPQEIRVWIIDQCPSAWSFHYLHAVPQPKGFPPKEDDLALLTDLARKIGACFRSRLICADFVRDRRGNWHFLEAGPGAVCGTAHEGVFKFVAAVLRGDRAMLNSDAVGGLL